MFFLILFVSVNLPHLCVSSTLQYCYNCEIASPCIGEVRIVSSQSECVGLLSSSVPVAEYQGSQCIVGTCDGLVISTSGNVVLRYSENSDCNIFELTKSADTKITNPQPDTYTDIQEEACLILCFNTAGCYMFEYSSHHDKCFIHTSCGTTCTTTFNNKMATYTKTCLNSSPTTMQSPTTTSTTTYTTSTATSTTTPTTTATTTPTTTPTTAPTTTFTTIPTTTSTTTPTTTQALTTTTTQASTTTTTIQDTATTPVSTTTSTTTQIPSTTTTTQVSTTTIATTTQFPTTTPTTQTPTSSIPASTTTSAATTASETTPVPLTTTTSQVPTSITTTQTPTTTPEIPLTTTTRKVPTTTTQADTTTTITQFPTTITQAPTTTSPTTTFISTQASWTTTTTQAPSTAPTPTSTKAATTGRSIIKTSSSVFRQKLYIMPCFCNTNKSFTNMTQEEIIAKLIADIKIDSRETASARNKLISKMDDRHSSRMVGLIGILILVIAFGGLFILDLLGFLRFILLSCRNGKNDRDTKEDKFIEY